MQIMQTTCCGVTYKIRPATRHELDGFPRGWDSYRQKWHRFMVAAPPTMTMRLFIYDDMESYDVFADGSNPAAIQDLDEACACIELVDVGDQYDNDAVDLDEVAQKYGL